jgi:hypothetical protein
MEEKVPSSPADSEEGTQTPKSSAPPSGPRTVDIFRATLSTVTSELLRDLKRDGFFQVVHSFETESYAKFCIQMASEIWILSFGVLKNDLMFVDLCFF